MNNYCSHEWARMDTNLARRCARAGQDSRGLNDDVNENENLAAELRYGFTNTSLIHSTNLSAVGV